MQNPNATLVATVATPQDARKAALRLEKPDYFAEYELSQDQRDIERLMRGNRAAFLS